jgi:hypothetical protein
VGNHSNVIRATTSSFVGVTTLACSAALPTLHEKVIKKLF